MHASFMHFVLIDTAQQGVTESLQAILAASESDPQTRFEKTAAFFEACGMLTRDENYDVCAAELDKACAILHNAKDDITQIAVSLKDVTSQTMLSFRASKLISSLPWTKERLDALDERVRDVDLDDPSVIKMFTDLGVGFPAPV